MKLGFCLPQLGSSLDRETVKDVAQRAEELGYDSLWVQDRLLRPLAPKTPYPASADGQLPERCVSVLEPLQTLAFVGALTTRIRLGTSVLVAPFRNPVELARQVATLDLLSDGRISLGLGIGWSEDEYEAAGVPFTEKGARMDEYVSVLKAVWGSDPVQFRGRYYQIAPSEIGPKPVQQPHPPLLLGAFRPAGMKRAATHADGWHPFSATPVETLEEQIAIVKRLADEAGRGSASMQFPLRVYLRITSEPLDERRLPLTGTLHQIKEDVPRLEEAGVTELVMETNFLRDVNEKADFLRYLELLRGLV